MGLYDRTSTILQLKERTEKSMAYEWFNLCMLTGGFCLLLGLAGWIEERLEKRAKRKRPRSGNSKRRKPKTT